MFTGIVETAGTVRAVEDRGAMRRIEIELGTVAEGVGIGDSIAVGGVCLTVAALSGALASFDVVAETLARTTLGDLEACDRVNLERSLRLGDRLGGHFVQGHVDGRGRVEKLESVEGAAELHVQVDGSLLRQMIHKGSVAVDGVSLTIAGLTGSGFYAALVPHTLEITTLGAVKAGDLVNVEVDMLGKYVLRLLEGRDEAR